MQEPHCTSRNSSSNSCLSRLRPRCSRTRWFLSVRGEHRADLFAGHPLDVAEQHHLALAGGQLADPDPDAVGELPASIRLSAASIQCSGGSAQPPAPLNRDGSTAGSGSATGTLRCSLLRVLRARLTRMRNSQVFSEES